MNRDPEIVRKVDPDNNPIMTKGACMDPQGRTIQGDDPEYSACMNQMKKAKAKQTASENQHKRQTIDEPLLQLPRCVCPKSPGKRAFALAAKKLHISQSALSQRVLNLEQEIGSALFSQGVLRHPPDRAWAKASALLPVQRNARVRVFWPTSVQVPPGP